MLIIGSHVGFNKTTQLVGSVEEAIRNKANTLMFYTGAPQNTMRYPLDNKLRDEAIQMMKDNEIDYSKVIVHAPYIVNLANSDEDKFNFSVRFLKEEIKRCDQLGIKNMVLHPGSHVGLGSDVGIKSIINGLNQILKEGKVRILLETMAGKGSEVGSRLEEIAEIINGVKNKERIGVCLDTCHLNDAGYDMSKFDEFLDKFDNLIGIDKIHCIHINDSKNELSSHKDRHENIGFGMIGFDNIIKIIYHDKLKDVPKILETPYVDREYSPYKYEIEMIRNKKIDPDLIEKIKNSN